MFFKNLMKWMIMITIMVTITSNFWFIFWIMMEMNMMMFIIIMKNNKMENSFSMIMYFIIQSFSSILFFMGSLFSLIQLSFLIELLINISVLIKMAMIPFHFWLISISEILDFNSFLMILTIQKIIPLFILTKIKMEISFFVSIISLIFSVILAFNLKIFKKILIFSSVSHQSWLIMLIFNMSNFWISYMIIYFMMIYSAIKILKKNNINSMYTFFFKKMLMNEKISMFITMMSLGGMPPFIGFFIKFLSLLILMKSSKLIMIILIISSLINIFIYIRLMMPILMSMTKYSMSFNFLKKIKWYSTNLLTILTLIMFNLMI
uniref:NADH-ubiquinone oxidoreductase chain 2 n=1 Tax=Haemaphysalis danieli TaxID=2204308 RepID=A0A976MYY5_9ACAR|nr:NADH dehydrogenase subunit 2 [Haemaphysalis danieli]UNO54027.1 NADH dehydrogenase subunit 2 [Haemaphysalis danieli]